LYDIAYRCNPYQQAITFSKSASFAHCLTSTIIIPTTNQVILTLTANNIICT
jgi:hypothetical protein